MPPPPEIAGSGLTGSHVSGSRLSGRVVPREAVPASTRAAMHALMAAYFEDVTEAAFSADLDEKDSVLLLEDESGTLRGFSTILRYEETLDGRPVVVYFSGDTLVHPDFWGETVLPRLWSQTVFARAAADAPTPTYWFLIASGYKTYRFLPTFFEAFYPTPAVPTPPDVQRLLDALATRRYGDRYRGGVVHLEHATPLRAGVAEIDARRRSDPFVAFFERVNPGHARGDELACLTRIAPDNVTPAGRRMLGLPPC